MCPNMHFGMVVELENNKDFYKDQILLMKDLIRQITDKSVEIQAQEARNKELMTRKFASIKTQARNVNCAFISLLTLHKGKT